MTKKTGLLLINLGTPAAPTAEAVGPYLNEFLMDPFVIDIPKALRWILVKLLIVPRRKHTSAEAYKTIWTKRGSPLLFHHLDLTEAVRKELGSDWQVESAMRYGEPAIGQALQKMRGVARIVVLPLYPQYAESSTRSSLEKVREELQRIQRMHAPSWKPKLEEIRYFHGDPLHIQAWAELLRENLRAHPAADLPSDTHILFSYHGLPERHLKKSDPSGTHCLDGGQPTPSESATRRYDCCLKAMEAKTTTACPAKATCYRSQAVETTFLIARELGLKPSQWSISFQSRLGRTPWIKPYTDEVIPKLAKEKGVKSLVVLTPSFTADCLETIEEIGDRAKEMFLAAGGKTFTRVECLNARPSWVKAVAALARARAAAPM